ncbi:MAG: fimbria/pilus outer membrane usher protein [Neisseriaceae bacterium]|nr:fimbria/pilus outer membrane usher protein [Neisseriaceae bacterium]MBP6862943.1 fimbria/pilus outer membrane usher protein [Neisseriaceae bacterium]
MAYFIPRMNVLSACVAIGLGAPYAHAVEFNTDILDVDERNDVDLSRFSEAGYVMPGTYVLDVYINKRVLPQQSIEYRAVAGAPNQSQACLPLSIIPKMLLKDEVQAKVKVSEDGECVDLSDIEGVTVIGSLNDAAIRINVPQAWLKYDDPDWTPPELWDEGIPGVLIDYNFTSRISKMEGGETNRDFSVYGTVGANAGPWRLRADYQASDYRYSGKSERDFKWSQIYAYRALPKIAARLTVGEQYLESDLFDGYRYLGANIRTDERMLPPSLQGYAPQVQGVATSNSTVTVSQDGRVIYKTTVPTGPFLIQDLSSAVRGKLLVTVEGDDGRIETFEIGTANVPYLTRPGQLRYNVSLGRPANMDHHIEGPMIATADFSWGVSNSWSLFGGAVGSQDYQAVAMGVGRDLAVFGAVSADVTRSTAKLPDGQSVSGHSFRLNYAKRFDELHGQITFAGYRFSQRQFMTVSQFLDAYNSERDAFRRDKELYTLTASKTFWPLDRKKALTAYLSLTKQTYWNDDDRDRISLSASKMFDVGGVKGVSVSVNAYQTKQYDDTFKGFMLNVSVPLDTPQRMNVGYSLQNSDGKLNHSATLSGGRDHTSWQVAAGVNSDKKANLRGYYNRDTSLASIGVNADWQDKGYKSVALDIRGGITATLKGVALHPDGVNGGARVLVDTGKVAGVPISNSSVRTNYFGKAVIPNVVSYADSVTQIDINRLADDVDAPSAVLSGTLTEGAIGYRKMAVVKGQKLLATIDLDDGQTQPPFGAVVTNQSGRTIAIVGESGLAYLSGVEEGEQLSVVWGGEPQCQITVPVASVTFASTTLSCQ